jgi:nicotinamidase-related amidase
MGPALADASRSVVLVIDVQPSFLKAIHEAGRVLERSEFLVKVANLLDVPVIATEQYPERMQGTDPSLLSVLPDKPIGKMTFSCVGCAGFDSALAATGRDQAVIVGIETHICVTQTAMHLLQRGMHVIVCEDAVSARRKEMSEIGFRRLRHAGADVAHSESVAYEWLVSAEHPRFRDALSVVKEFSA